MKNVLFYAVLFAFLLISGCTWLLDAPQPEPVEPGPAPEAELTEPLLPQPAPDSEEEPPREPVEIEGLVLVSDLDDSIILDLKYATADNFTGEQVYPVAVAAINKDTGLRFLKAVEIFRRDGYTVKLWDAYRPLSASHQLWASCPDPRYVIKPEDPPPTSGFRPRHNNGMCVDITLVDSNGNELEMPTGFDDYTEKAAPDYPHVSEAARRNRDYLISVMESAGFQVARTEWWHFTDITGTPGPYLDVPLEAFS